MSFEGGKENVLPRVARDCYKRLLCPAQDNPTATKPTVEFFQLNTGGASLGAEIERVCIDNVLEHAIVKGADSQDFYGTAYGHHEGKFDGFKLGDANVQLDDTLLLIELEAVKVYEAEHQPATPPG